MDITEQLRDAFHGHVGRDAADEIERLRRELANEKERADYAWRNANTIEKARQEEMAKRDKLTEAGTIALKVLLQAADEGWSVDCEDAINALRCVINLGTRHG